MNICPVCKDKFEPEGYCARCAGEKEPHRSAAKKTSLPTVAELWEVQIQNFPTSIQLTPKQVIDWAANRQPDAFNMWMSIAMTIQYPVGIWYTLDKLENVWGFRYGTEPYQYVSGFTI